MAKLIYGVLLVLWACGGRSNTHEAHDTHAHPEHSPTHAHTLGRWAGVTGRNLSCGDLTEVVRVGTIIIDFIDEFKDSYTQAAIGGLTWEAVDQHLPISYDYDSIQVCMEADQSCIPVLPRLQPNITLENDRDVKSMMVVMIGFLQRYSVAAVTLVLDQSLAENDLGFLDEMVDLQTQLEELIEVFLIPLTSCNLTPDPKQVMEFGRRMHQRVEEDSRDMRGFMGLRQIRLGLLYLLDVFSEPQPDSPKSGKRVQGRAVEKS